MRTSDCPYGADACPKTELIEDRLALLENRQMKIYRLLYIIAGIVTSELGLVIM